MDPVTIIIVALVLVLLAAGAWYFMRMQQRRRLTGRFGPEYERAVHDIGSRREAERELTRREQRVAMLDIRPLDREERLRYGAEWQRVQALFVDEPARAVREADLLIAEAMQRRGYPMGDFEARAADLSVDHADVVQHYRAGRLLAERSRLGQADTEDLRQAMVHYRALFEDLLRPPQRDESVRKHA